MTTDFIQSGQRLFCPNCKRVQLFSRAVPIAALPIVIRCGFGDCQYTIAYSTEDSPPIFPKLDAKNIVKGNWLVEMQQGNEKDYWKSTTPGQISFQDRCKAIATHTAGALQNVQSLRADLDHLATALTDQFAAEHSLTNSFIKYWNPSKAMNFIKQPFCCLPIICQDKFIGSRTRLFFSPDFYSPIVGFPLQGFGGYSAQLITPYTLINFPMESHLQNFMDVMPSPDIRVVDDRVVGRDLFRCWRDIPGVVPDREHHEDAPLMRIQQSQKARTWLARLGIAPWNVGQLTEQHAFPALWTYYSGSASDGVKASEARVFKQFVEHGRVALFYANPLDAWSVASTIGSYVHGSKLALMPPSEDRSLYQHVQASARETRSTKPFHWKEIKRVEDMPDQQTLQGVEFMIVHYDRSFPTEALEKLYNYNGRLIIISQDPVMDTLTENWEASLLFGLVAKTIWQPNLPAAEATFNYESDIVMQSPVGLILRQWVDSSKIRKGKI